jgi:hypothetical protein
MHEVDLCWVVIAFNSVLRRRVEVELKRLEFTVLSISVSKVQITTLFVDVDLPRKVHRWKITVLIGFLCFLVLFLLVSREINSQFRLISLHCPVTEVNG